jgi:hypothetical protein
VPSSSFTGHSGTAIRTPEGELTLCGTRGYSIDHGARHGPEPPKKRVLTPFPRPFPRPAAIVYVAGTTRSQLAAARQHTPDGGGTFSAPPKRDSRLSFRRRELVKSDGQETPAREYYPTPRTPKNEKRFLTPFLLLPRLPVQSQAPVPAG